MTNNYLYVSKSLYILLELTPQFNFMKKLFLIIIAVFGIHLTSNAQSAEISSMWLEHNVSYSGYNCLAIHFECEVNDMQGKTVNMSAYFFDVDGNGIRAHYGVPAQFRSVNGQLCAGMNVRVAYESSYWEDVVLYIPYTMFSQPGSYQCVVQIAHSSYGVLALSSEESFDIYR